MGGFGPTISDLSRCRQRILCATLFNFFTIDGLILRLARIAFQNRIVARVWMMLGQHLAGIFTPRVQRLSALVFKRFACLGFLGQTFFR